MINSFVRISAILLKSIPPLPVYLRANPSARVVVAVPKILGPIILKTVEAIAQIIMTVSTGANGFKNTSNLNTEPLKFFAFSPGIMPAPLPGPPILGPFCLLSLIYG